MIKHTPELDSFRAYAAMSVVAAHHLPWELLPLPHLLYGRMGVTAFFVLSGFLITSILLGYAAKVESGASTYYDAWKTFFVRRALRIFPLYFLALALFGLGLNHFRAPGDVWWHVTYTSNLGQAFFNQNFGGFNHFWSLCVEEQFYMLWPLLILSVGTNRAMLLVQITIAISLATTLLFVFNDLDGKQIAYSPVGVNSLALGLGAFLACMRSKAGQLSHFSNYLLGIAVIVFAAASFLPDKTLSGGQQLALHDSAWAYICFYLVYVCTTREIRFLRNKATMWLGKISYGIYVYHMLISVFLWYFFNALELDRNAHPYLDASVSIILSISLATVSYYLFEVHFLKLKSKLAPD